MSLPSPIIAVLAHFQPLFTAPTWRKVMILLVGTILARGRRTVTAALRQVGQQRNAHFSNFHQVLNRARWSALEVSRRLLQVLLRAFGGGGTIDIVIDETLERRWGRKIHKRGHYRDSLLSSKERSVSNSGLRWITMALVVTLPWTKLRWALPFFSVLATPPAVSEALGQRHKTIARLAQHMVLIVHSFLPENSIKVIGDSAYSVIELGLTCLKQGVSLMAPLRLDARLFAPPPPPRPHQMVRWNRTQARSHDGHCPLVFHRHGSAAHSLGADARPRGQARTEGVLFDQSGAMRGRDCGRRSLALAHRSPLRGESRSSGSRNAASMV